MFGQSPFYWASLRKMAVVFGNMFNDISIQRFDADGNAIKTIKVPIAYGPRQGYLVRLREDAQRSNAPNVAITLPRMSFEYSGFQYRPEAQMPQLGRIRKAKTDNTSTYASIFNPVPYTIAMDLNLYTKNIDDSLQIVEQILPYFAPDQNVTIKEVPELDIRNDVKIKIVGFEQDQQYEGVLGDDLILQWTFNFEIETVLYSGITDKGVIKTVIANTDIGDDGTVDQVITQWVNPLTADPDDTYTIDKTIVEPNG